MVSGDLEAATAQACRFLALDVDARGWPEVGRRVVSVIQDYENFNGASWRGAA